MSHFSNFGVCTKTMIELLRNEKHMNKLWRKLGENSNLLKRDFTKRYYSSSTWIWKTRDVDMRSQ